MGTWLPRAVGWECSPPPLAASQEKSAPRGQRGGPPLPRPLWGQRVPHPPLAPLTQLEGGWNQRACRPSLMPVHPLGRELTL